jgi:hypothetical protein
MTWRERFSRAAREAASRAQRARQASILQGQKAMRVVAQTAGKARLTGRAMARKVIGVQLGAGLDSAHRGRFQRDSPQDLMRKSAASVVLPQGDKAWREGYREVAAAFVPSLHSPLLAPPSPPSRPAPWPQPRGPEPDGPEAGA